MKIRKFCSIAIWITIVLVFFGFWVHLLINGEIYYLKPKSPDGVRLYTRTTGLGFPAFSRVYIQYSLFDRVPTDVVFEEDDGAGLYGDNADYIVEWIDDSHVSVSFKGCDPYAYPDYETEVIEY